MENLEDLRDDLRVAEWALQDLKFQTDVCHSANPSVTEEIARTEEFVRVTKEKISELLGSEPEDESLRVQNEIVARYGKMLRISPDKAAFWFAKSYAATFRTLWNQWRREISEIEHLMYHKGGS